jgi:hypothetical protein
MKTKISLVLLGLGLVCGSAYAGAVAEPMPVSNDINVTAPDQSGMWSFGATAVFMQPSNKAFNYADVSSAALNGTQFSSTTDNKSVDEGYGWWFGADVAYAFPGNGRDVTLAYEGLHTDTTNNAAAGDNSVLTSTFSGLPYLTAEGETKTNYDAGDLVFGQKMDVGSRIRLHPFMGVRYAHINTKDTGAYGNGADSSFVFDTVNPFPTSTSSSESGELENTFNGIGPRFGSDAQVNLGQGFSIRGRLGLSALIGSRSVDASGLLTYYDVNNAVVGSVTGKNNSESETRVVPEIDGRLGLNYTYNFDSNMALGMEAGWQATNYFNVVADSFNSDTQHYEGNSNFALQGPYARLQLDIA